MYTGLISGRGKQVTAFMQEQRLGWRLGCWQSGGLGEGGETTIMLHQLGGEHERQRGALHYDCRVEVDCDQT